MDSSNTTTTTTHGKGEEVFTVSDQAVHKNTTGSKSYEGSRKGSVWRNKDSFADKLKSTPELQVAIFTEPLRVFTDDERLDIIDLIGNALYQTSENDPIPKFISTTRQGQYLIVTPEDEESKTWLMRTVPDLQIWEGTKLHVIPAKDATRMKKGLLWLPGRQKLENQEILRRIARHNPLLMTSEWRVLNRHEENHGIRLLIGLTEEAEQKLKEKDYRPQWSTTRAQFTPIEAVIERRKHLKQQKKVGKNEERKYNLMTKNKDSNINSQKRKKMAEDSMEQGSPKENLEPTPEEVELLQGRSDAFTPTRVLPRSPGNLKFIQRPVKKKKVKENVDSPKLSGKITEFFQPGGTPSSSQPAGKESSEHGKPNGKPPETINDGTTGRAVNTEGPGIIGGCTSGEGTQE